MTNSQRSSKESFPIVMTIKETNVPRNFAVIGRLNDGEVLVLSKEFLQGDLEDREVLRDMD